MPTVSVRITEEELRRWQRYGPISRTVRDAMEQYERSEKRKEFFKDLRKLQKEHPIQIDPDQIVRIIREDRQSH